MMLVLPLRRLQAALPFGAAVLGALTAAAPQHGAMAPLADAVQNRCLSATSSDQQGPREDVCTSLAEASRRGAQVSRLHLDRSEDLMCTNMLCEKVGEACICRLSRVLERAKGVRALGLSGNGLEELPASLWECHSLEELDLSNNRLVSISGVGQLLRLQMLDISGNPIKPTLAEELAPLQHLKELRVDEEMARHLPDDLGAVGGAKPRLVVVAR